MIMYKQFRVKSGKLYPLFVNQDVETPMGVWVDAEDGPRTDDGKVKSKLGKLAYRPGFHLSEIPLASHIGKKDRQTGVIAFAHPDTVWAECEVCTEIDYNPEARENGWLNGKWCAKRAQLAHIPVCGYYWYRTNPKMIGRWVIAGRIKVNRVLTYREEEEICQRFGLHAQPRLTPYTSAIWREVIAE